MNEGEIGLVLRDTILVTLKLGGPVLLAALAVGVLLSLFQAVTQINEATLAFLPKAAVIVAALALGGPFMLATLTDFSHRLMDDMITAGGR